VQATSRLGAPVLIALGLTWFLAERVDKSLGAIQDSVVATGKVIEAHASQTTAIERYLRVICVSTAGTPDDKRECLR
jgi:hypothetical protein